MRMPVFILLRFRDLRRGFIASLRLHRKCHEPTAARLD
jgi:hypothetical protein